MPRGREHGWAFGRAPALWLLGIVVLAGFLRIFHLTQTPPGLYPDEAMNGNNALEALRTGDFKVYYPENQGREGLMIALQALSLATFGVREPWVLRFPSAVVGVLTVCGMFFLGRELVSSKVGLLAAFLMATSTWHIYFSRMGFRAILAPLLMVWALYLFLASLRRAGSGDSWLGIAVAGGAVFGLGFYSYIAFRVMPLVFLAFLPWRRTEAAFWRVTGAFVLSTFVVALPIGVFYVSNPDAFVGRSSEVSVFAGERPITTFVSNIGKTLGMLFVNGDENWRHNFAGEAELFWPVAAMLVIGTAMAAVALLYRTANSRAHALIVAWIGLAVLPVALSSEGIPHALRSLLMLPPVLLLAAVGGVAMADRLGQYLRPSWVVPACAALVCVALTGEAYYTYFVRYAPRPDVAVAFNADYVTIGRAMEQLPGNVAKVVVVDAAGLAVRGQRVATQTVMFITDTFDPDIARQKNVFYVDPDDEGSAPPGVTFHVR